MNRILAILLLAAVVLLAGIPAYAEENYSLWNSELSSTSISGYVDSQISWNWPNADAGYWSETWSPDWTQLPEVQQVPEPSSIALSTLALIALLARRRKQSFEG
jgi:hypothetical protein